MQEELKLPRCQSCNLSYLYCRCTTKWVRLRGEYPKRRTLAQALAAQGGRSIIL